MQSCASLHDSSLWSCACLHGSRFCEYLRVCLERIVGCVALCESSGLFVTGGCRTVPPKLISQVNCLSESHRSTTLCVRKSGVRKPMQATLYQANQNVPNVGPARCCSKDLTSSFPKSKTPLTAVSPLLYLLQRITHCFF